MATQGVIFDLGHTLMHLDGTWPEVFDRGAVDLQDFLAGEGLNLDAVAFSQVLLRARSEGFARAKATMREVTAEETMRWTFSRFGLPDPPPSLLAGAIDAFFAYEYDHWFPDPAARPVLEVLAGRGLRLGMFSNATHDLFIQGLVDRFGFRPWLEPALSSAGTGLRKPDPAAFAPFLSAWRLDPESIVVVGDTLEADIVGAQRAGMSSIWIRSRHDARQEGREHARQDEADASGLHAADDVVPDAVITRLTELPEVLSALE
jgi:HAD superfamily hydrolase (TIGR01549 family)